MRILLFLDDMELQTRILKHFEKFEYQFDILDEASHVFDTIYKNIYDIVIFSIFEPSLVTLDLVKQIRENKIRIPIILVTKLLNFEYLKLGYEYGCSDYIREPFELEELRYRMLQSCRHCHFDTNENIIYLKNKFIYDLNKYQLSKNNVMIKLTATENKIIKHLVKHICRKCTIEDLADALSEDKIVNCNTVRMHIKRIKEKCGKHLIENVKGFGYYICRDKPEFV
jgi:DNA-binding response OmpR family regulator